MATFAVIDNNIVKNIIIGDNKEEVEKVVGSVIEYTDENPAGIGWIYEPETNTFIKPITED